MDNYTFELKRPLIIPSNTVQNALMVFRPSHFALSYSMMPNPKEGYMVVTLTIVDKASGNEVFQIFSYTITEQGFATGVILNQAAIDAWVASFGSINDAKNALEATLVDKQSEEYQYLADKLDVPAELTLEIESLTEQVAEAVAQLEELGDKPEPVELHINKYSDVLQYFDNKGAITADGVLWAKQIPFMGLKIGDFII